MWKTLHRVDRATGKEQNHVEKPGKHAHQPRMIRAAQQAEHHRQQTGRDQHDYPGQRPSAGSPPEIVLPVTSSETNSTATPAMLVTSTLLASIPPAMSKRRSGVTR